MTSTHTDENLLKTDTRGRVRTPRARREAILAEFAASGLSAARFARLAGINYTTFCGWLHRQPVMLCMERQSSGFEFSKAGT